jgi:SpoIIAA-like
MPVTLQREDAGRLVLGITGLLRKAELDDVQRQMLGMMRQDGAGSVRLLVVLDAFEGWEPGARWNDLSFYVNHGDALERIAIVGDERWRDHMLMFTAADLRKGPVEYFTPSRLAEARAWLAG